MPYGTNVNNFQLRKRREATYASAEEFARWNSDGDPFIGKNAYIRLHGRNEGAWYAHAPKVQTSITSAHANGAKATYTAGESPNGSTRYCYDYSENELAQFVPIIKAAGKEGKKVQVYFNNHPNGSGAKNGLKLKEMVAEDFL